ncbi:MAG: hypothetical protein ACP5SD_02170 [Elusimicrobiales bacterium]
MSGVFPAELTADISKAQKTKTEKDIAAFLFLGNVSCSEDFLDIMENISIKEEISFEDNKKNQDLNNSENEESLDIGAFGESLDSVLLLTPDYTQKFEKKDQKIGNNLNIENEKICEIISNDKSFAFDEKNEAKGINETKKVLLKDFTNEKNFEPAKNEALEPKKNPVLSEKIDIKNEIKILEKTDKVALNEKDGVKNNKIDLNNNAKTDKENKDSDLKIKFQNLETQIGPKKDFLKEENSDFYKSEQKLNSSKLLKPKELKDGFEVFSENRDFSLKNFKNVNQDGENKSYSIDRGYQNNQKEKTSTERIKLDISDEKIGKINLDMKIKNGEMSIKFDSEDKEKNKSVIFNKSEIEEQIVKNTGIKKAEISLNVNPEDRKEKNEKNKKKASYIKKNDKNKEPFNVEI